MNETAPSKIIFLPFICFSCLHFYNIFSFFFYLLRRRRRLSCYLTPTKVIQMDSISMCVCVYIFFSYNAMLFAIKFEAGKQKMRKWERERWGFITIIQESTEGNFVWEQRERNSERSHYPKPLRYEYQIKAVRESRAMGNKKKIWILKIKVQKHTHTHLQTGQSQETKTCWNKYLLKLLSFVQFNFLFCEKFCPRSKAFVLFFFSSSNVIRLHFICRCEWRLAFSLGDSKQL
jgi:hypothetical protein